MSCWLTLTGLVGLFVWLARF